MDSCTHHHHHGIDDALKTAQDICDTQGLRFTNLRRKVLELVCRNHHPIKAYDILEQLDDVASAKPPTVYRTLDFLLEHGLVHKLNSLNAYVRCSHPQQHEGCYFLICTQCNTITECCTDILEKAIHTTTRHYDFIPRYATVEIAGLCNHCQQQEP